MWILKYFYIFQVSFQVSRCCSSGLSTGWLQDRNLHQLNSGCIPPYFSSHSIQPTAAGKVFSGSLWQAHRHLSVSYTSSMTPSSVLTAVNTPLSVMATRHNSSFFKQKDTLPRLPVPEIHETMEKYLKWVVQL